MLGSVTDAEDAAQDAFLRLQTTDYVTSPEGFLVRTTRRRNVIKDRYKPGELS
jgi:RNA polymerase sigma-70 factor, ECF subfamily